MGALQAFIPHLLSRLHIEALIHGNMTKQVSFVLVLSIAHKEDQRFQISNAALCDDIINSELQLEVSCSLWITHVLMHAKNISIFVHDFV